VGAVVVGGELEAPVDAVAAVLADPRAYDGIVFGVRRVLWFDAGWPATGSRLRHTVGSGPVAVRGQTEVLAGELPDRLELAVGLGPAGALSAEFRLHARRAPDAGTRIEIVTEPRSGLVARLWSAPVERVLRRHDTEVIRRLGALAAERARVQALDQDR
jgi:hypothetical protein